MTIVSLLILILVVVAIGCLAYWIVNKFFPEPMRMIALAVVGVLLLLVVLYQFFPGAAGTRVF